MSERLDKLVQALQAKFADTVVSLTQVHGELTLVVKAEDLLTVAQGLRDDAAMKFDTLIDACGMDYLRHGEGVWEGARFAAVYHLLSVAMNQRLRLRVFAPDDDMPVLSSVIDIWPPG